MAATGYCPSGRLFEAAACGAAIISDYWTGLEHFFEPGREILLARNMQDTMAALNHSPESLSRIASSARERALSQHTASHRAVEFEKLLDAALLRSELAETA
jgi:spore maturation protein CgeB